MFQNSALVVYFGGANKNSLKSSTAHRIWLLVVALLLCIPLGAKALDVPSRVQMSGSSASYTISWSCSGSYCLVNENDGSGWTTVGTPGQTSVTISHSSTGAYRYRKQTCIAGGNRSGSYVNCSYGSEETTTIVQKLGTPGTISFSKSSPNDGEFTFTWGASSNFKQGNVYTLFRRKNSGSWAYVKTGSSRSHTEPGLSVGTYQYRVKACGTGCSSYRTSSTITVAKPALVPGFTLAGTSDNGDYTVSWGSVGNTASYQLQEKVGNGTWSRVGNTSSRFFEPEPRKTNGTYSYQVRACNAAGCSSYTPVKTIIVARTPGVPSSITVPTSATDGTFDVNWGGSSGTVTKYDLDRQKVGETTWSHPHDKNTRMHPEPGLGLGSYKYRVRAEWHLLKRKYLK